MDHLDKHSSLNPFQHGFRQKRSCETQLVTTVRDFTDYLNRKGQIDAVLLDFSKAFNKVDHEKLLAKLHNFFFPNESFSFIINPRGEERTD